ncbi:MAG: UvrD-helicase domain-containing protein, partial [Arenimonas sp.]|nr:UvrD-helicase domain-containing protein [Arenimonas sp.]
MTELPLSYRIPLDGITLIEASAGTGKTHTLIRIMARHLLWYNRPIDQILAVTFTEAATTELKSRLRDFLYELKHYFAHPYGNEDIDALFSNAPEHITETELYFRITHAIANIDKAAVFTIHGFCQRLLNEQPLLTGQSIPSPQFIEIQHALIEQICQEFWRQRNLDANGAEALQATWASPAHMQRMVADLLSSAKLTPERPAHLVKPDFDLAYSQFKAVFQEHAVEAKQLLLQAIENKILSGVSHKIKKTEEQFFALTHFFQHGHRSTSLDLSQIATSKLKTNANKACPNHPLFDAADQWLLFADSYQLYKENLSLCLLHDFRVFLRQRLHQLKMQRNQMSFDDLIDRLHLALQSLQGQQLAEIIRKAYPVALVDEFQDTDDRQWAIFKSIYFNQEHTNLILIGDPKQAIYAFRGGDIHTYLNASESATHHETLHGNYRSNQALLTAIDRLFTHQHPHPFYEQGIDFIPVDAMKKPGHVWIGDEKLEPIQFIKVGSSDTEKKLSKSLATLHCAQQCATQVAWLVHEIDAGNAFVRTEDSTHPLNHHDIVILVATHQQAKLMQDRLLAHAVRSVCVDKSNVFDSYEALDVLNILRLLTNPSGWQLQQNAAHGVLLQCITGCQDFSMFDVSTYQELMIKQGVLACFNALLTSIEQAVLALPFGERRLSNYWQLVELIQQQYTQTQSGIEIVDWLCSKIEQSREAVTESSQDSPRLESGAPRIRIMTLHQSKGLEFGIVFMPFSAISPSQKQSKDKLNRYFDGRQRCLFYRMQDPDDDLAQKIQLEQDSESLRILYVGVTRARYHLILSYGWVNQIERCALTRVLLRDEPVKQAAIDQALSLFSE